VTRKDYVRIADAIKLARYQTEDTKDANYVLNVVTDLIAGELKEDNIRFDRQRFATAAGRE
jgi:hypothetical protein